MEVFEKKMEKDFTSYAPEMKKEAFIFPSRPKCCENDTNLAPKGVYELYFSRGGQNAKDSVL